ncbi:hypothetical protein RhiJN_09404 [Ceratobasidium sp. AG-Ba]|nr:hypothetical protein RhiJN_09404 [Ceratobasidium sp. AG-Ba]QRW10206.1 hypothetical protein RhiLY_09205 [Ceratobasidium sp. AG-Ba]
MRPFTNSGARIPPELILMILRHTLANPISVPPSPADHQLRVSLLLLTRKIRETLIKDIYKTVILWDVCAIRGFANAFDASPHLGSLIFNLWIGSTDMALVEDLGHQSVEGDCLRSIAHVLSGTPNLQRLYVSIDLMGSWTNFTCPIPDTIQHLALPVNWVYRTAPWDHGSYAALEPVSFRMRGRPQGGEALALKYFVSNPSRVVIELDRPDSDFSHVGVYLNEMLNPDLQANGNRKCFIDIVSPPPVLARSRTALARFAESRGSGFDMHRVRAVSQALDDVSQLEFWLHEGEHPFIGPF